MGPDSLRSVTCDRCSGFLHRRSLRSHRVRRRNFAAICVARLLASLLLPTAGELVRLLLVTLVVLAQVQRILRGIEQMPVLQVLHSSAMRHVGWVRTTGENWPGRRRGL